MSLEEELLKIEEEEEIKNQKININIPNLEISKFEQIPKDRFAISPLLVSSKSFPEFLKNEGIPVKTLLLDELTIYGKKDSVNNELNLIMATKYPEAKAILSHYIKPFDNGSTIDAYGGANVYVIVPNEVFNIKKEVIIEESNEQKNKKEQMTINFN